ncbi:hypothetical protein M885DRAFT_504838 [Pelagophyceae sp. CCMP2097]|nr:hypothetical protein M885DRAFT_504838 [Pelagophyceae sp. CCMP2097]
MARRGGAEDTEAIEAAIEREDVVEWRSVCVENPKGEPTVEERDALRAAKESEKKAKALILERVNARLEVAGKKIKKDKVSKVLDSRCKALESELEEAASRPSYLNPPSGTRDFEPADMRLRNWLFGEMRKTAEEFGFKEYDAPVLEHVELYERKAGEEISEQMYNFVDKEGTRVTLRPEMTPSLARMVLNQTNLSTGEVRATLPLKWYSIPQCWRFETTQRGRKREHYQWNMDVVGEKAVTAELELLAAACRFFQRLGIGPDKVGFRVNSRKVLDAALAKAGVPQDLFSKVCVVIDKLDKIGAPAVHDILTAAPLSLPKDAADKVLACLAAKNVRELGVICGDPNMPAILELDSLFEMAKSYGCDGYLDFDASVVRGLAYYTGVVFEAFDRKGELRAICGGGRYDKLLALYGGDKCQIPCCGFGFGDCVIVELLKELNLMPNLEASIEFVVAPFSESMQAPACEVARALRDAGYSVDTVLAPRKARATFDIANRAGARRVAFVGPDEWANGLVRIKDMVVKDPSTGEGLQLDVAIGELANVDALLRQLADKVGAAWPESAGGAQRPAPAAAQPLQFDATPDAAGFRLRATSKFAVL